MSKEVFHSLIELNAKGELNTFDEKASKLKMKNASLGILMSGRTIKETIMVGTDILDKILDNILAVMGIYWDKYKVMGLDLTEWATDEFDSYFKTIEFKINNSLSILDKKPFNVDKEIQKQLSTFQSEAIIKIKHTSTIIKGGINPNIGIISLPKISNIDLKIEEQNVINSVIYGNLNQTINNLSKENPELTIALKELLKILESVFKDTDPKKINESMDYISTITDEISKPPEKRRRFTITSCLEGITRLSSGIDGADNLVQRIKDLF